MKKLISIIVCALMLGTIFALSVSAMSYNPQTHWDLSRVGQITVKKADPADVVKDGVIGENEYVRFEPDLNPDSTFLHMIYMTGTDFDNAMTMLQTMEYYFSWDEVHGFNFAIRNTPPVLQQHLKPKDEDPPQDDFVQNAAYVFGTSPESNGDVPTLYYAVARNTDTLEYMEGHYNQFGPRGSYDPVPDVDYCITYSGNTSLLEWSIPFEDIFPNLGEGSVLRCTISVTAGETEVPDFSSMYGIVLGDMGFGVGQKVRVNDAEFLISGETIKEPGSTTGPGSTAEPGTEPGSGSATEPGATEPGNPGSPADPADPANPAGPSAPAGPADPVAPGNASGAPKTGDPAMILAALSALGACGAAALKRRSGR